MADAHVYAFLLRECKCVLEGRRIHEDIIRDGLMQDRYLGNMLVQMYGNCGGPDDAFTVFSHLQKRNSFTWNIFMTAYVQNGNLHKAKLVFNRMPDLDVVAFTTIMSAYAQTGLLEEASAMFNTMPEKNVVGWTAMMRGYAQHGHLDKAHDLFEVMPKRNAISWNVIISACYQNGKLDFMMKLSNQMPQRNVVTCSTMVCAFAQSGQLAFARNIFERMPHQNVTTWNAMIQAYAQHTNLREARMLFEQIPERDDISWTTMIGAYAQLGHLNNTNCTLSQLFRRSVITLAYSAECVKLFKIMDLEGYSPVAATYVAVLNACATAADVVEGKLIHSVMSDSILESSLRVRSALISMYGKCGELEIARLIFDKIIVHDVVSWTAMITAYAQNGHANEAMEVFQKLKLDGIQPDMVIFRSFISACSHSGLEDAGWKKLISMQWDYNLKPGLEHYVCVMDLLGRAGQAEEVKDMIDKMPFEPNIVSWMTLLDSCRACGYDELGTEAANQVLQLDPECNAPFTLLSNIYATE